MRWVGYVALTGEMRNAYKILEGDDSEDRGVDGKIVLERMLGLFGSTLVNLMVRHSEQSFP